LKAFFARFLSDTSSSVTVNGKTYRGNSVSISNGRVVVDGVEQDQALTQNIEIKIDGPVQELETACGNVNVTGSVGRVKTTSGDVQCGDVGTSVQTTSGDVACKNVGTSVSSVSGDISAGTIQGADSTVTGDIRR
jgi:hypothetical protein